MTPEDKALLDDILRRANSDQTRDDAEKAHVCTTRDVSYGDHEAMTAAFRDCCKVRLIGNDGKVRSTTSRQCTRLECPQCEDEISALKDDRATLLRILGEEQLAHAKTLLASFEAERNRGQEIDKALTEACTEEHNKNAEWRSRARIAEARLEEYKAVDWPNCSGEWISGSGGMRGHNPCSHPAMYWHPSDMFAYCEAHIVEHEKDRYWHASTWRDKVEAALEVVYASRTLRRVGGQYDDAHTIAEAKWFEALNAIDASDNAAKRKE